MFGTNGKKSSFTGLDRAAGTIVGLGALNWGLVGVADFDAVRAVLGKTTAAKAVYALVGASAAYAVLRGPKLVRK